MTSPISTADSVDNAIAFCQRHQLMTAPSAIPGHMYGGRPVNIGSFWFDCHQHDTGNDVRIWIYRDGKSLEIVNTTFWFSNRYTFNKSKWMCGAWDESLKAAIDQMYLAVAGHVLGAIAETARHLSESLRLAEEQRAFFERPFVEQSA